MRVELSLIRLAFEQVFTAKAVTEGDDPGFSASGLFPPGHPAEAKIRGAIETVAKEEYGDKWATELKRLEAKGKTPLHNGDDKDYDGFAGNLYVSARNSKRPNVFNRDGTPLAEDDGVVYSGCYVDMIVEVFHYRHKTGGPGISAQLKAVRFRKDGDAFAGGVPVKPEEFSDLSAEEGDGDISL